MGKHTQNISRLKWVYISGAAFILFLLFSIILIVYAPLLTSFGITKSIFYILLIPAGLCSAAFLFGAMRSYANYSGNVAHGHLELSGPVVIFCLVILGGIFLAPPSSTFLLTVRVYKQGDKADIIREGKIILDLASQRIEKEIGKNGEVLFAGIPSDFLGKEINLLPNVSGYVAVNPGTYKITDDKVIQMELTKKKESAVVRGTVLDSIGNPLGNVTVDFESGTAITKSNENGNFMITIGVAPGTTMLVTASLNGKIGYRDYVTIPESGSLTIPYKTAN